MLIFWKSPFFRHFRKLPTYFSALFFNGSSVSCMRYPLFFAINYTINNYFFDIFSGYLRKNLSSDFVSIYAHAHMCMCSYAHIRTYSYTHKLICSGFNPYCADVHIHTCLYEQIHIYIHVHILICSYVHIHTYTQFIAQHCRRGRIQIFWAFLFSF